MTHREWQNYLMTATKDANWRDRNWDNYEGLWPGMVMRRRDASDKGQFSADGYEYFLVGNVNASSGTCGCCGLDQDPDNGWQVCDWLNS